MELRGAIDRGLNLEIHILTLLRNLDVWKYIVLVLYFLVHLEMLSGIAYVVPVNSYNLPVAHMPLTQ